MRTALFSLFLFAFSFANASLDEAFHIDYWCQPPGMLLGVVSMLLIVLAFLAFFFSVLMGVIKQEARVAAYKNTGFSMLVASFLLVVFYIIAPALVNAVGLGALPITLLLVSASMIASGTVRYQCNNHITSCRIIALGVIMAGVFLFFYALMVHQQISAMPPECLIYG